MATPYTVVARVGEGGKVELTLPEATSGDLVGVTIEPLEGKHPERIGWAPGSVIWVGTDFDQPYETE